MKIEKHFRPELVVSKGKEPNPLLTDPYLDVKAKRIVATDNHALVAIPVEVEKTERSRYLACSLLEAARKLGEDDVPAEIKDQEIIEFGVLWPAAQERTFPDWQKLVPPFHRGDPGTVTLTLNARLLKSLADAIGSSGGVALTYDPAKQDAAILVQPIFPDAKEFGLLMPLAEPGDDEVGPDQRCPVCRKLLAAGAACPEHGAPVVPALAKAVERVKEAAAAIDGGGASITVRVGGKEVTATPAQLRAGLAELQRRKTAVPALDWATVYGGIEADLPDGSTFRIAETASGTYDLARVKPGKNGTTVIARNLDTETAAKKRAVQVLAEGAADELLRNAGAGDLTKKDTRGDAVARKKGGRR